MLPFEDLTLEQIDAILCADSFRRFVEHCWPYVSNDTFVPGYHVDAICEHLQAVEKHEIRRLVINVGIRHSKSLLCSVLFPVYLWLKRPDTRIITATYSKDLTVRDAVRSRQLIEHQEFKKLYPHIELIDDTNRKDYYQNQHKGYRFSASIGARTAGFDADVIIADDIMDFSTRTSEAERNNAIDYFETTLSHRLVYTGKEAIVLAGHRIHEDDIYQRLRDKYGDSGVWSWLVLPEEYTPKFKGYYNGIGWSDKRHIEGELLWPEKYNADKVEEEKKAYRHEYSTIFLQEPIPAEGTIIKKEWFRFYSTTDDAYILGEKQFHKANALRFATVDTALSTTNTADYTVCQIWDICNNNLVLVDQLRKKLDGNQIIPELAAFIKKHKVLWASIEVEFVGKFVIDNLRAQNITCRPFHSKQHGDKEARARFKAIGLEIKLEAKQIWFPSNQGWTTVLCNELLSFPNGLHDDTVDCASLACIVAAKYTSDEKEQPTPEEAKSIMEKAEQERINLIMNAGILYPGPPPKKTITYRTTDYRNPPAKY